MREPREEENTANMLDEGAMTKKDKTIPAGNSEFDFSCFEETEDDALEQDLDPATFRQFVEDAAERMSSSESVTALTASNSAHSLDAASENAPAEARQEQHLSAHTRLGYNQLVGQDAWLVISVTPPFSILAVSPAWTELFGFREKEIVGRSMRIVQGPQTNVRDLTQGIKTASETGNNYTAAFMFYTKRMEGRMMTIDVTPEKDDEDEYGAESSITHAVVTMDHSDWVPKKIAYAEDSRAKVVILADKPHSVVSISNKFSDIYQLQESMIVGRTMRAIFGPKTNEAAFRQLLALAKTGKTQNLDLWTCRADVSEVHVHVTLFPVMDDATISHVMVVFKEIERHADGEIFTRRSSAAWLAGAPDPGSPKSNGRPMSEEPGGYTGHGPGPLGILGQRRGMPSLDLDKGEDDMPSPVAGAKPEQT